MKRNIFLPVTALVVTMLFSSFSTFNGSMNQTDDAIELVKRSGGARSVTTIEVLAFISIVVKGNAGIAGTILLFAHYLQEDKLFSKVDVITINNLKDTDWYDFELNIIL